MRTVFLLVLLVLVIMTGALSRSIQTLGEQIDFQSLRLSGMEVELTRTLKDMEDRLFNDDGGIGHLHAKIDHIHEVDLNAILRALEPILVPQPLPQPHNNGVPYDRDRQARTLEIQVQ